jgi:hypothetical protein
MNPLDPNTWADWVNDRLSDFATMVVNAIIGLLLDPPNLLDSTWAGLLFGNAKGVAPSLANAAVVIAAFLLIVSRRRAAKLLPTLLLAVIVLAGLPVFYWFMNQVYEAGNTLTVAAQFGEDVGAQGQQQVLPVATNVILGFFGFFIIANLSMIVYVILAIYAFLNVPVLFWIPLVALFYFLSVGSRKVVKALIAILIVAMLTGRPTFMLFLSSGRFFTGLVGAEDELMQFAVAIIGLVVGIASQALLFWFAYSGVSYVESKIQGGRNHSEVRGTVKTEQDSPMKVALANAFNIHANGLQTSPKVSASEVLATHEQRSVARKQQVTSAASEIVAAGATYFGVPYKAARVVTGAGSRQINRGIESRAVERATSRSQQATRVHDEPPRRPQPHTPRAGTAKPLADVDISRIVTHGSEVKPRDRGQ